ncbi:hypothetical protein [Stygiolobus caldivivus]|uniref:Uncharacterized protein n=1 Tax=Stygiolobus caldivivus TaxID=2824673 RepID=A0A8D5U9C8_9CREN|nr:hypothetical protein [Stygiolobus caldivivus]BCU71136.1 hypothetical protein KN1_24330 [Stygiolobus caldivivus]
MSSSQPSYKVQFEGKAKIGEIMGGFIPIQLKPEDLASPISFQMALSRIYEELMKSLNQGPSKKYVAEVKFTDSLGNPVVVGVDLGQSIPPLSNKEVKVKITIEFYDEE